MNQRDDLDRMLSVWLDDPFTPPAPVYLGEVLERTRRTRQRHAWASLERWLPMTLTRRRPMLAPPLRLPAVGLALLLALLAAMALAPILSQPSRLAATVTNWSNGLIALSRAGIIFVVDPSGGEPRVLIGGMTNDTDPDWSPDGTKIAFWRSVDGGDVLMVAGADGSDPGQVSPEVYVDHAGFWWSPDGSEIAIVSVVGSDPSISLIRPDGTGARVLDVGMPVYSVSWHPDGASLLFRSQGPNGAGVYTVRLADGKVSAPILTSDTTTQFFAQDHGDNDLYAPSYSPDGSMIAWSNGVLLGAGHAARSFPYSRSYVANADGTDVRSLEISAASDDEDGVTWSPDGTRLSMHLRNGDDDQIAILRAEDGHPLVTTKPAPNPGNWLGHAWAPDGSTILTWRGEEGSTAFIDTRTGKTTPEAWLGGLTQDWQPVAAQP